VIVRHLSLPSRGDLVVKRDQGIRRVDAGFSPDIGWQLQRLAPLTEAGLDEYWNNNSWHLGADGRPVVGTYDRLEEDDALAVIGNGLANDHGIFANDPQDPDPTTGEACVTEVSSRSFELVVESLVNDLGHSEVVRDGRLGEARRALSERTAWALELELDVQRLGDRLVALQGEFDERTAWALQLDAGLQQRDRELAAIKSSALWRAGKALHLEPRSGPARRT
jgi:hypothetical protein